MNTTDSIYERYITIFENTGAGTILIDEDTTIIMVNNRFATMLGYSKAEIEGRMSWTQFIHPEDVERMKKYHFMRRKNPESAPKNYEFRIFTKEGKLRFIYLTIDMIPETKLSVASLTDITSLVETREALQKSEEQYRMLVETMNDGLLVQDSECIIQYVNPRFCDIIGYSADEIVGKTIYSFIHPDYIQHFNLQMQKRKQGIQDAYELAWIKKDGSIAHTILSPRIISNDTTMFTGSFAVITDITERKMWERTLQQSEELFAGVFDATPVALALVNMETGVIIKANKMFRSIAKYTNGDRKKLLFDLGIVKKQDIRKLYKQLLKFKKVSDYEIQLVYDGQEHTAILAVELIRIHNENMVILSLTDITEKRALEKELLKISENERKSIGQDLHDDIIPHLLGIDVMLKVIAIDVQKNNAVTLKEIENIRQLIDEAVMKVRQLSKGLSPSYFISNQGLSSLIEELCSITENIYGIPCSYKQWGTIKINDPNILTQIYYIVKSAVHNAVRHSGAKIIQVSTNIENDTMQITVEDNGKGFDSYTEDGMGLKIMKHRAATIGATLQILSNIDKGTKIIIKLQNR